MRSTTRWDLDGHCPRCLFRHEVCLCPITPRIETRTRVLIVRHVQERMRTSNTGRLVALALPNSEIIDYGIPGPFDDQPLRRPDCWLLFPGFGAGPGAESAEEDASCDVDVPLDDELPAAGSASTVGASPRVGGSGRAVREMNVATPGVGAADLTPLAKPGTLGATDGRSAPTPAAAPPRNLVVLDATWRQARRMFCRIEALRPMSKMSLPPPPPGRRRMRQPTHAGGMSTVEAIAEALSVLEGPGLAEPLLDFHAEAVRRSFSLQGR